MLQYQLQSGGVLTPSGWPLAESGFGSEEIPSVGSFIEALETKTILYYLIPSVLYIKIPLPW